MRWFWQRRKPKDEPIPAPRERQNSGTATLIRGEPALSQPYRRGEGHEPRDELLRFARDYLVTAGARVRVEDDEVISATLPDGTSVRYTVSLARARMEEDLQLLVEGGAAFTTLLDASAELGQISALRLADQLDATRLALEAIPTIPRDCGRCLGGSDARLPGIPSCSTCPLREGRLALAWAGGVPTTARVERQWEATSVELTFLVVARDRQGRTDDRLRLAFAVETGLEREPLTPGQISSATAAALPSAAAKLVERALEQGRETMAPRLQAASAFLLQRTADDYRRHADELSSTSERWRRENPTLAREANVTLARELAALREVYRIDVEAQLESVCFVASSMAQVALVRPKAGDMLLTVDVGRGQFETPACSACGIVSAAGMVCEQGHFSCASCSQACVTCGRRRCTICQPEPFASCATCGEVACDTCLRTCSRCGECACADHIWTCRDGGEAVCLSCATLCQQCEHAVCIDHAQRCAVCDATLCAEHVSRCFSCASVLCADHLRRCSTCGTALCAEHSVICAACSSAVCTRDVFHCLGCGRDMCSCAVPAACRSCGMSYCIHCRAEDGECPACRALLPATEGDLVLLARAAATEPELAKPQRWLVGRNAEATVWSARGLGRQPLYVIASDGSVVATRRKGLLERASR
ncbi:MAG TPA: hypothetical protein VGP82_16455 [Ktedonobacterales bacterium]|nr:hypothetical protein [Ktedonobacterales bacterium]